MNKKLLATYVKREAKNLRKYATNAEKKQLIIKELSPSNTKYCLYGLMTGDCYSSRAQYLINKSCVRMYDSIHNPSKILRTKNFERTDWDDKFSAIEVFITFYENEKNGNNEMLIDYLKGKRKTLRFKKF